MNVNITQVQEVTSNGEINIVNLDTFFAVGGYIKDYFASNPFVFGFSHPTTVNCGMVALTTSPTQVQFVPQNPTYQAATHILEEGSYTLGTGFNLTTGGKLERSTTAKGSAAAAALISYRIKTGDLEKLEEIQKEIGSYEVFIQVDNAVLTEVIRGEKEHLADFKRAFVLSAEFAKGAIDKLLGIEYQTSNAALAALVTKLQNLNMTGGKNKGEILIPKDPEDITAWEKRFKEVFNLLIDKSLERDRQEDHRPAYYMVTVDQKEKHITLTPKFVNSHQTPSSLINFGDDIQSVYQQVSTATASLKVGQEMVAVETPPVELYTTLEEALQDNGIVNSSSPAINKAAIVKLSTQLLANTQVTIVQLITDAAVIISCARESIELDEDTLATYPATCYVLLDASKWTLRKP